MERVGRDSQVGFCAMWFNKELDPLWHEVIEPAIVQAGYEAKRADKEEHNNLADDELIAWIRRSRFIIADLTNHSHGVYFEAGFAMGLGLPVIWMVRKDDAEGIHFDNRQYQRIEWEPDKLDDAKNRVQDRIVATIGEGPLIKH